MNKHLEQLREKMRERGIDVYVVPTSDYHESEYVSEHFACRRYITGFTGSAGTAVVTMEKAGLWTDGRYFVQAAKQLEGSGVTLQKMGVEGVPTILEYLRQAMPEGGTLGFDGRVINELLGEEMEAAVAARHAKIAYGEDLVGMIWADRPALSREPVWILDEKYCGKSAAEKIADLRAAMREAGADVHVLTALDDIVWLLNIRGNDVPCNPVVLSYLAVTETEVLLFIQEEALDDSARSYLESLGVAVKPYDSIYDYVKTLAGQAVMVEKSRVNYALCHNLDASCRVIDRMNPTALAKAVKNPVEMENIRRAHIKDGVAVTKYIYWLKKNIGKIPMDEMSVADRLEEFRREQEGYLGPSFNTISAYGPNAAMCHYSATEESKAVLEPRGLYLVDSGGQYYEGTTDITRTIALGELTAEEREHFTLTAMSMLRLGNVKFLHGCRGLNLDYVAREVFWQRGLNFDHGTGHGVGYLLNVHERPNGIRWKVVPERQDSGVLEEGMLTSDEPGIYVEGSHGIRTENLILCRKAEKTEYGQFMRFEFVTFVPIDLDAIDKSLMRPEDVEMLNAYHREVYEKISPYLTEEEADWLREATREI
ncbi:MAG TPA: aminopeptidase P family protein [Candidatus Lachnoclostridium stercoripullorum]|uniref:Aminopeptidase P family protein n=1 Tax=Candidatus Lachnoclostridium stercoripullorum TaxID=2838635 RepID=A0A9D2AWY9_9FIRM|nr:aminopeptidase P family protein [Candidatus Lachnoclostridium stercoripullorum]